VVNENPKILVILSKVFLAAPTLMIKGDLLKLLLDSQENWHAIKKLFNLPFPILKVRYPAKL